MGSENRSGKVPLISKIAYGFGDVGCNFSWMFVSNFLMIFYTDVFGISMAAVSALMLFSRFWDAINDPIVGGLTDKTKTRWGRYRPWLLVAAPITAVLLVMTFWARPDWNQTAKIVYMVITYCLLVLGYTCVNIPYGTLCGAMTQDIDERAKINTSRSVAAMIAIGVLNIITVPLINKFGSSSAKTGYLTVAVIYGCIFAACHFFCFAKTKEAVITPEKEKISIKVQLKAVLQNRPYLLALVGQILFGFTLYGRNADVLYYFTYVEGNASYYIFSSATPEMPSGRAGNGILHSVHSKCATFLPPGAFQTSRSAGDQFSPPFPGKPAKYNSDYGVRRTDFSCGPRLRAVPPGICLQATSGVLQTVSRELLKSHSYTADP